MSEVKCPLCGYRFDALQHAGGCANCILFKSCELLRCPNCNYEFPIPDKGLLKFVKEIRQKDDQCGESVCK
jgi:rubredoxin